MAELGGVPPWLDVRPSQFVQAAAEGASAGLRLRAQQASETEAADRLRLAYDSLAAHERAQDEAAQSRMALAESQMAMRQQQFDAANALREAQLRGLEGYRQQRLGQFATGTEQRQAAADALNEYRQRRLEQIDRAQDISAEKAQAMVNRGEASVVDFPELPGVKFVRNPSGAVFRVTGALREPSVRLGPTGQLESMTGPLSSPAVQAFMGTNVPAGLRPPGTPAPPAAPAGPGLFRRIGQFLTGGDETGGIQPILPGAGEALAAPQGTTAPSAAETKLERAKELRRLHPDWTKQDILDQVNSE